MPIEGGATYVAPTGGLYAYEYGSNWGALEGTTVFEEYVGIITLRADFSQKRFRVASVVWETSRSGAPICAPLWGGDRPNPPRPRPLTTRCISALRPSRRMALSKAPTLQSRIRYEAWRNRAGIGADSFPIAPTAPAIRASWRASLRASLRKTTAAGGSCRGYSTP